MAERITGQTDRQTDRSRFFISKDIIYFSLSVLCTACRKKTSDIIERDMDVSLKSIYFEFNPNY